jgi:hypothetical protein
MKDATANTRIDGRYSRIVRVDPLQQGKKVGVLQGRMAHFPGLS